MPPAGANRDPWWDPSAWSRRIMVLVAYGFDPVPFPEGSEFARIALDAWGGLKTDRNQMTSLAGVFAGGDSVRGPSLVVHAVRDGGGSSRYPPLPHGNQGRGSARLTLRVPVVGGLAEAATGPSVPPRRRRRSGALHE
jgi:hypothetical protein